MTTLFRRIHFLLHRRRFREELEEEFRHHLACMAEREGSAEAARVEFGNVTLFREESRKMWVGAFWDQLWQDLRYGFRAMVANKIFTAMAVLSLALGIGANTAIYSFMDAILVRSLPVQRPAELVVLNWKSKAEAPIVHSHWGDSYDEPGGLTVSPNFPYGAFELMRDKNTAFSKLWGHANGGRVNLLIQGQAELGEGHYVTGGFFAGLGVPSAAGRLISPEDDRPGAPAVVVLTYDYWRTRFGSNSAVLGSTMRINGTPFTVIGVSAPEFFGVSPESRPNLFIPMAQIGMVDVRMDWPNRMRDGTFYWIQLMGRLRPGFDLKTAEVRTAPILHQFIQSTITKDRERANIPMLWLQEGGSGFDSLRRQYSRLLWVMMAMVGLILGIACANIANLLLSRSAARRREMAVRLSLGASRWRVFRQLLTESTLLALLGGALGIFIAAIGIRLLVLMLTNGTSPFSVDVGLDWRVLGFNLGIAVLTGILFGLAPALQATRTDVTPALKETRSGAVRIRTSRWSLPFGLSHVLVVAQISLCLLLVVAAGLFVRTLSNLRSVSLGFNSQNVLLFSLDASKAGMQGTVVREFYLSMQRRFQSTPGVVGVTMTDLPLVGGWSSRSSITVPGIPKPAEGQRGANTALLNVGPGFFETMQLPIVAGRAIVPEDTESRPEVAVVNEVFAAKYFPRGALGNYFGFNGEKRDHIQIVGIAKNARYNSLKREIPPVTYLAFAQEPLRGRPHNMFYELRTVVDPLALGTSVRKIVHDAAPLVPVADLTTQNRRIEQTITQERMFASVCSAFGVLALIMACVGLYGMMAYSVARRTSEIGIRMALGAARGNILWLVLREVLLLAVFGLGIGYAAAYISSSALSSFLFELKPNDPAATVTAMLILTTCALVAGYAPAWRASRIQPMEALRHE